MILWYYVIWNIVMYTGQLFGLLDTAWEEYTACRMNLEGNLSLSTLWRRNWRPMTPLILHLHTGLRWVVEIRPWPLCCQASTLDCFHKRVGGLQGRYVRFGKENNLPLTGIRTPDLPARVIVCISAECWP